MSERQPSPSGIRWLTHAMHALGTNKFLEKRMVRIWLNAAKLEAL
jgi:hypothetical protein